MAYNAGEARLAVVPDPTGFKAKLEADLRRVQASFSVQVGADTTSAAQHLAAFRAREAANAVNLRVDVDTGRAQAQLAALRTASSGLGGGGGALGINAGLLGLSAVGPAALGVAQLAGALQQLSQAAFVVPGAIGGAVASIGTLAIGVSGVKTAYEAVTAAATSSGQNQAAQARQSAGAANTLRNAQKDLAQAYRDTRQEVTDLNIELNGGRISEKQAINDALRARRDLMTGSYKDALDYADAQLRVEAADQRVVESHQRNIDLQDRVNEANAQGISGNERVVRAQQAVADAQANVAATATAASMMQQKANEEMAKLAPNAREFVDALVATKDARDKIRQAAQQPLFAGLAVELKQLTSSLLPSVTVGVGNIATAWNRNITQLMRSVGSDNSRGLLDRLLGNTADAQSRFTRAIDPLVRGIGTLAAAGSDSLPRIAEGIGTVSERFAKFIEDADSDGRLERWIDEGIDGFTDLGNIVLNIGKSITAITEAAGGSLLSTLSDLTGRMATFLNSAEGQQSLREFFQQARQDLENWRPILESLPGLFRGLMDAGREWAAIVLPPLAQVSTLLAEHPGLITGVVTAFAAWKTIGGVASLIDNLNKISTLLGVTLPAQAASGSAKASTSLAAIGRAVGPIAAVLAVGEFGPDIQKWIESNVPGASWLDSLPNVGDWGKSARDWVDQHVLGEGRPGTSAPVGPLPTAGKPVLPQVLSPAPQPPAPGPGPQPGSDALNPGFFLGPKRSGGPTPSGRGPGPTGGWLAEIHDDEWILPKHARQAVGDKALWALTQGRSFEPGGYVDQYGNPVTPGAAPGPAAGATPQIAANPYQGGGIPGILGSFMQGIQGPIGNAISLGSGLASTAGAAPAADQHGLNLAQPGLTAGAAPSFADRMSQVPGLWGLVASSASSDPVGNMSAWGQQTASWLGNWASNTLTSFGSALWQGALGFFGLENSILSPNNAWNQAGQKAGQFFLGSDGPVGALLGSGASGSGAAPQLGQQTITLGDGTQIAIPTFGTANGAAGAAPEPYGLPAGSNSGGYGGSGVKFPPWVYQLGAAFGVKPSTYPGHQEGSGVNRGIDWVGPVENMQRFAEYLSSIGGMEQVIWQNPTTGQRIGVADGRRVGPGTDQPGYYRNDWADHANHVHTRQSFSIPLPGGATVAPAGAAAAPPQWNADWQAMAQGESGGNWHINTNNGFYGGLQFTQSSWKAAGGLQFAPRADLATPTQQMMTAERLLAMQGPGAWPNTFVPATHDVGGLVPPGASMVVNRTGGNEYILNRPQAETAAHALAAQKILPKPRGGFQPVPDAKVKQLPAPIGSGAAPAAEPPVPVAQPPATVPTPAAPPSGPAAPPMTAGAAPQIAPATPGGTNHNLSAIDTAISSTATTVGNIAATAASMGAAAGGAGPLSGMVGSLVGGLAQQGGKIAQDLVNVGSSFLVGSVPGSFGGPPGSNPYGQTVRAEQNVPATATPRVQNNTFNGMDIPKVFQQLDLREAQASQAELANK